MAEHEQIDLDTKAEETLLAASNHDIPTLQRLLRTESTLVNYRDPETLITPLHAAVLSCEEDDETDGTDGAVHGQALDEEEAVKTIKYLFENGAIWNDLNVENETPGCIAIRLGLKQAYETIVEAGVRAELLLHRLDGFQMLIDEDDDEDDDIVDEEEQDHSENHNAEASVTNGDHSVMTNGDHDIPSAAVNGIPNGDDVAAIATENGQVSNEAVESDKYLESQLEFEQGRLLDADKNGVMMAWETAIMQKSADALCPRPGLKVLNVGHGMGIIDGILQTKQPSAHHIIEAHPGVLEKMRQEWSDKPGVTVHPGKWQDIVTELESQNVKFDAIYFDTFAEDYSDLKDFFAAHVPKLLSPGGKFGFFNGLGADRQVCQDVYKRIVELDLFEAGLDVDWTTLDVPDLDQQHEWDGVRRSYWALKIYALPTCTFTS